MDAKRQPFLKGTIILWYGAFETVPAGWKACTGNWGTPNLMDRFIVGSGSSFNPGDEGGSVNHTHAFSGDGHTHLVGAGASIAAGADYDESTGDGYTYGTTDDGDGRPPYHSLFYIMKI